MSENTGQFVHLHLHTEYSILDGINRVDTLPEYIKSIGQDTVSITDHGNVSGTYKFWKNCKKAGVKPILGMEAYYTVTDRSAKEVDSDGEKYYHLVLLAQNNTGLKNLMKLSTKAYTEGMYHKPRCDDALLNECAEGLIATSACLGSRASQLILKSRFDEAERLITHHAGIFKDRFFLEIQLHNDRAQQIVNLSLVDIAKRTGLPLVLTNDCHYTKEDEKTLHEQALCMQTNDVMTNPKRFSFGEIDVHVASHDWMKTQAEFHGLPYEAISNTVDVAKLIDSKSYFNDTYNRYPRFKDLPINMPAWEALENLAKEELTKKFNGMPPKEYRDRLNSELETIKKMGFYDYLLIVQDFIGEAREHDIIVGPGRGSAAGSLVAYSLGITQVDPIKYGLLFERWLNYGRAATPLIFTDEMSSLVRD